MLTVYRRHSPKCKSQSMSEKRCHCPLRVNGTIDGKLIRQSLKTRVWDIGQKKVRDWEAAGIVFLTVKEAWERFVEDCIARGLGDAQLGKYRLMKTEMEKEFGSQSMRSVTADDLARYRKTWKLSGVSSRKKLERLRTFFRFSQERGWSQGNPAKVLKPPKEKQKQVLPFSDGEWEKILWATEVYPDRRKGRREQVKAFVLVLRWTGLAIGDAISLETGMATGNQIARRRAKTDVAVSLPMPDEVVSSLQRLPTPAGRFFWSGQGKLKSAVANWQRSLKKRFDLAGIVGGHPHRFRHTFSVDLLSKGVSLENVSKALGHSSVKITEKFYGAWVKSRQEALDSEIRKAWAL